MRWREAINADGGVRSEAVAFRRVCGAPIGVYAALVRHTAGALLHGALDPLGPHAMEHVLRAWHLAGYVAGTATHWWAGVPPPCPLDEAGFGSST